MISDHMEAEENGAETQEGRAESAPAAPPTQLQAGAQLGAAPTLNDTSDTSFPAPWPKSCLSAPRPEANIVVGDSDVAEAARGEQAPATLPRPEAQAKPKPKKRPRRHAPPGGEAQAGSSGDAPPMQPGQVRLPPGRPSHPGPKLPPPPPPLLRAHASLASGDAPHQTVLRRVGGAASQ